MQPPTTIPRFLLPRGIPPIRILQALTATSRLTTTTTTTTSPHRCASSKSSSKKEKPIVLPQPDKFRPPSHPQRRVVRTSNGRLMTPDPVHYGPRLTEQEKEAQRKKQYPNMFPPEGTVAHKFLTSRGIHVWIAMGVLTSLATFTFTTNFKRTSPFAHMLPSWSDLLSHPFSTVRQALAVFRMHVEHSSRQTREKRRQRVDDAEKRRQYRIAHGLEEAPEEEGAAAAATTGIAGEAVDDQSPVARDLAGDEVQGTYVDWDGQKRPVKKWLGIW
ncbi:uncharacterized protein BP01DRAFT_357210 [Aspergillus saccharolyticus JOP 1030-1]|uniref:Uncharacterized protein n=1 Tax=Aspergillus saccharolyticus JOP 1030-1 TaxID=1450539 RepID=A0A318ZEZ3_9EURO|nr:hypothetical protein BP01DRAFT_357210 [Aspergillus saccharolyticus JOP 1030-1]PYH44864.1 hypothetical protein BP01DRAFT_357210 [Aspergillus saccharolyticus JOP 1030-1]